MIIVVVMMLLVVIIRLLLIIVVVIVFSLLLLFPDSAVARVWSTAEPTPMARQATLASIRSFS